MKKIFGIFLSLSLIISPVAHAQMCDSSMPEQTGYEKIKDQVMTLAISSVGANILLSCLMGSSSNSLKLFMGASITHLTSEMRYGRSIKELYQQNTNDLANLKETMVQGGDLQKAAIEKQLSDEEKKLDFVKKRIMFLKIALIMYGVATLLATFEMLYPPAGCIPNPGPSLLTSTAIVAAFTLPNMQNSGLFGALLFLFAPIHANLVPILYNTAAMRTGTFGASSLLIVNVIEGLKEIQSKLECRILKLQTLLAKMNLDTNSGEDGLVEGGVPKEYDPSAQNYEVQALPAATTGPRLCYSNGPEGFSQTAEACKNPYKVTRPKFDANFALPSLRSAANLSFDISDAIAAGDFDRAEVLGSQLESQASKLTSLRDDLIKQVNDKLKSQGKAPIDYDKQVKDRASSMSSDFDKMVKDNKGGALAAYKTGDSALGSEKKSTDNLLNVTAAGVGAELGASPSDFGLTERVGAENLVESPLNKVENSFTENKSNESDIASDPDVSIFKQVSNRYFLNYTKIFQRKEIAPPLAEPETLK